MWKPLYKVYHHIMDVKKEKNMHTNIIKLHKQIKIMNNILHHVQALNRCSMSKRLNKIRNVEFSVQTSDLVIQ